MVRKTADTRRNGVGVEYSTRIYDRIRRGESAPLSEEVESVNPEAERQALEEAQVFSVDEVTRYFLALMKRETLTFRDRFPVVIPPYETMFVETRLGREEATRWPGSGVRGWGILLRAQDITKMEEAGSPAPEEITLEKSKEMVSALNGLSEIESSKFGELLDPIRWYCGGNLFYETESGRVLGPTTSAFFGLAPDGGFARIRENTASEEWMPSGSVDSREEPGVVCWVSSVLTDEAARKGFADFSAHLLAPLYMALTFMNANNVGFSRVDPPVKLSRKHEKRSGVGLSSYYTLEIGGLREALSREGGVERQGIRRALHLCRGHLRRYTPERGGPGGRHIEEPMTVWIPPHLRGSRDEGEIHKDYRVSPKPSFDVPSTASSEGDTGESRAH